MSQPLTHSFPLLLPTVLLLLGIVFAGWVGWSVGVWVASLSATLIVLFLCRRHPKASNFLILTALFQLGAWLSAQAEAGLHRLLPKEKVCYEAVVMSEPVPRGKVVRFDMAVLQHQGKPLLVKAQLLRDTISHRYDRLHVGDGLRAVSILETPQRWAASTFDYARWLRLHGFSAQTFLLPSNWQKARVSLQPLGWWNRLVLQARQVRQRLLDRYRQWQIGGDEAAVVAALSLGDKSGLSKRLRDDYSRAGVAHVLALSGLHLGILCGLFSLFSRRRSGRWLSSLLTLTCAWAFALLTGLSPSVVRAALLLSLYSVFFLALRRPQPLNVLLATVLLMVLVRPLLVYDLGFQLSVLSVLSIHLFLPILVPPFLVAPKTSRRAVWWRRLARGLWTFASLSIAAQIGTSPLVAYAFGSLPTYFLISNLVAVPCATLLLYLVVALFLTTPLPVVQTVVAQMVVSVAKVMNEVLRWVSSLPCATIELHPTILQTVLCYALLLTIWAMGWRLQQRFQSSKNELTCEEPYPYCKNALLLIKRKAPNFVLSKNLSNFVRQ